MNEDSISSAVGEEKAPPAQQFAGQVREQAQHVATQVREQAQQVAGQARDQVQRAMNSSDQYVRENPWPVVLGAAGVGLLVGYALAQRHEPSMRERYLDEPLDHARTILASLVGPLAGRARKEYGHVREALEEAAEQLKDAQPVRQARRFRFW